MQHDGEFMTVNYTYQPLMKKTGYVENRYILATGYGGNNVWLQWHGVKINNCYFVETTNVYYHTFFFRIVF